MSKPDKPDDIDIIIELADERMWSTRDLADKTGLSYHIICDMKIAGRASERTINRCLKALGYYSPHEKKS